MNAEQKPIDRKAIKQRILEWEDGENERYFRLPWDTTKQCPAYTDLCWLIVEVERLTADNERLLAADERLCAINERSTALNSELVAELTALKAKFESERGEL